MCDQDFQDRGDLVPEDTLLYRGCNSPNFLSKPDRKSVRDRAFLKNGEKHPDGMSLAFTMLDSVKHLGENHGAVSIYVRDIYAAAQSAGIQVEVRYDLQNPQQHARIHNMPCKNRQNEETAALKLAEQLAKNATVASSDPIDVPTGMGLPEEH